MVQSGSLRKASETDYFQLLSKGEPDGKKIVEFLRYKKEDVSSAADIPLRSVRYDQKMPIELREHLIQWATAINLVGNFFGDGDKATLWFQIPNPLFGNMTPRNMIRVGRFKKLLRMIKAALEEDVR